MAENDDNHQLAMQAAEAGLRQTEQALVNDATWATNFSANAGGTYELVTEIAGTPRVHVRLHTEVAAARGDHRLTELVLRDRATARDETVPAAALFVMIGATPHTDWLPGDVARDRHGFILTGRDLPGEDRAKAGQPVPLPLETSLPGVFAAGDVHAGSAQRVASAVGEGSVAVPQVHQHLQRQATQPAR